MGGINKLQSLGHEDPGGRGVASSPAGAVSGSPAGWRVTVYRAFDPLVPEWEALALASRNLFATPEWLRLWWECCGGSARLALVAARDPGGRLVGIVPLSVARIGPLRVARFLGHGMGDLLGPIHARETDGPPLVERALLAIQDEWDLFLGERLSGGAGWSGEPETAELRRESNPVIRLSDWTGWDEYVQALGRKLRQSLRHDERRLTGHRVRFRVTRDPPELQKDLDTVFALHRARWDGCRSSFVPREAFHRRFAALALQRGWLRLSVLEVDDRAVAARFDFEFAGVYHAYNGGRDPAWNHAGVGMVLRAHTIREAMSRSVEEYRLLRGGESDKKRFVHAAS